MSPTLKQARAAKAHALKIFQELGEVLGVGITRVDGTFAVKVNLRELPDQNVHLPDTVDGVPVRVAVVGSLRKR